MKQQQVVDEKKIIEIVKGTKPFFKDIEAIHSIKVKGRADYATQVDYAIQMYLMKAFGALYPEIHFLGEENYDDQKVEGYTWIVDPVDGTTNLIHNYHQSAVSVGLSDGEKVVLGIIYNPYTEELFLAKREEGAYRNGEPIHVSDVSTIDRSLIAIGTSPYNHEYAEENFEVFKKVFVDCEDIRRCGSAALELTKVALGQCEAYFERNLKIWDYAAGMLLVEEAGGSVISYSGGRIGMEKKNNLIASNGKIGTQLIDYLKD